MTDMTKGRSGWGPSLCGVALAGLLGTPAMAADGVIVTGATVDYGGNFSMGAEDGETFPQRDVCNGSTQYAERLQLLLDHTDSVMQDAAGAALLAAPQANSRGPNGYDGSRDAAVAMESLCAEVDSRATVEPFVMAYAACRMGMFSPSGSMLINLASNAGSITMYAADHQSKDIMQISLTESLGEVSGLMRQWDDVVEMRRDGGRSEHLGLSTERYTFSSTSSGSGGLSAMMSFAVEGFAWVAENAPGSDVVRAFYETLSRSAPPSEGTMIDGIIKNMVGTLSEGLPLYTESTTTVTMMGRAQPPNRSISVVTGLRERRLSWDDCGVPPTPAGYRITDMGAQISQAMGGADAAGMPSNEDMAQIMRQYEEAMAGMTDEERDILAQFGGADALRQGMPGGSAVPGTPPPSTGGAATSGAIVGATSAGLMGGSVEESVSNHLQALGYDTGNGASAALMTSIAISQYQAERGMPVTGEASQQLLDELARAVP